MVNNVLQDIWDGSVLFQSSMHKLHRARFLTNEDIISSSYGRRGPGVRYRYQDASLFKLSRLRVPRYRHIINLASFCVLLTLYVSVLHVRSAYFSAVECMFWLWGFGFVIDEIVAFNDAGFTLYVMSLWNIFDSIILLLIVSFTVLRVLCFWFRQNGQHDKYLFCTRTAYDLLAAGAIFLFPRLFSFLDNYQNFSRMFISARRMIIDLITAMIVISLCSSGFWVAFTMAFARDVFTADQVAYDLLKIFFGFSPAVWNSWEYYSVIGRVVLLLFLFMCNFLVITILVAVLTNSFAEVTQNAHEEHRYQFAVNTITMIKSESSSLFAYAVPLNLIEWVIRPLNYVLPLRDFLILNRTIIKVTHLPILLSIFTYEKMYVKLAANKEKKKKEAIKERHKNVQHRQQELQKQQAQYEIQQEERKKQKIRKNQGPPMKGHTKTASSSSSNLKSSKGKKGTKKALLGGNGEVSTSNLLVLNAQMDALDQSGEPIVSNQDLLDEVFQRPYEGSVRASFSYANSHIHPSGENRPTTGYGSMGSTNMTAKPTSPSVRVASRTQAPSVVAGDEDFRLRRTRSRQRQDSIWSQSRYFNPNLTPSNRNASGQYIHNSDPEEFGKHVDDGMMNDGADDEADSEPDATDVPDDFSLYGAGGGRVRPEKQKSSGTRSNSGIKYFSQFRRDGSPVQLPAPVVRKYSGFQSHAKLEPISSYEDEKEIFFPRTGGRKTPKESKLFTGEINSTNDSITPSVGQLPVVNATGTVRRPPKRIMSREQVASPNSFKTSKISATEGDAESESESDMSCDDVKLTIPNYLKRSRLMSTTSSTIPGAGGGSGMGTGMALSPTVSTTSAFEKYLIQGSHLKPMGRGRLRNIMIDDDDGYTIKGKGKSSNRDDDDDDDEDDEDEEEEDEEEEEEKDSLDPSDMAEEIQSMTRMVIGRMDELESSVKKIEHLLTALAIQGGGGSTAEEADNDSLGTTKTGSRKSAAFAQKSAVSTPTSNPTPPLASTSASAPAPTQMLTSTQIPAVTVSAVLSLADKSKVDDSDVITRSSSSTKVNLRPTQDPDRRKLQGRGLPAVLKKGGNPGVMRVPTEADFYQSEDEYEDILGSEE